VSWGPREALDRARGTVAIGAIAWAWGAFAALSVVTPAGQPLRTLAGALSASSMRFTALRPKVIGREHMLESPCVFAANHASYLDTPVLLATLPWNVIYVIKKEMEAVPLIGRAWRRSGHVFVDRDDPERALASMAEATAKVRAGSRLVIFPEGTFTERVGLRPFLPGAFKVAADAGVPVVPIALRGTRRALPAGRMIAAPVEIEVELLPPIAPLGTSDADVKELSDRTAEAILSRLGEPALRPIRGRKSGS